MNAQQRVAKKTVARIGFMNFMHGDTSLMLQNQN